VKTLDELAHTCGLAPRKLTPLQLAYSNLFQWYFQLSAGSRLPWHSEYGIAWLFASELGYMQRDLKEGTDRDMDEFHRRGKL
jgi:hypothetical protein